MFYMKGKEDYVCLYNMQDVLTSLTLIIDFVKKMSAKLYLNFLNILTLASFS